MERNDRAFQSAAAEEDRRLPDFEEIIGFAEVPESDVKELKDRYITPYVASFVREVEGLAQIRGMGIEAMEQVQREAWKECPDLMEDLLRPYFQEKVYGPLFDALIKVVPEYQELKDNPIQPFERSEEPDESGPGAGLRELESIAKGTAETPRLNEAELKRMDRFAELYRRPEVADILKTEYRPMQERAQAMVLDLFKRIGEEALAKAVEAAKGN